MKRGTSYEKLSNEVKKVLRILGITHSDIQDEKMGPLFIGEYRKKVSKRKNHEAYMKLLSGFNDSSFQDIECYLRTVLVWLELRSYWICFE